MSRQRIDCVYRFLTPVVLFVIISLFLTYNILSTPSLVIGDNSYWSKPTIVDMLGLRVVLESYLGATNMLSAFRIGFLFPLVYVFDSFNLPITLVYPLLFYFFCMLAFYALSKEFLQNKFLRLVVSMMYVINPVVPYYFASLLSAFVLIFLPLALKFFIKSLRDLDQSSEPRYLIKNFALSGMFLSLSISAHEQFFLSAAVIATYFTLTFLVVCFRKYRKTRIFIRVSSTNILLFASMIVIINLPLIISINNIGQSPSATYYSGRFNDFLLNVQYSYTNADFATLLRFGGDSGVGLGFDSWFDSNTYSNLFGYILFIAFVVSFLLLVFRKDRASTDKAFFYMNIMMFVNALLLIQFMKALPNNRTLSEELFSSLLQTWESPAKLRVLLLLSALTTALIAFKNLETGSKLARRKILKGMIVVVIVLSTVVYNSPWLIGYAGYTPMQQIADHLKWGSLFEDKYSKLTSLLETNYVDERGVLIPYTHKAELYVPPYFRLFQLVSEVNENATKLTQGFVSWSKMLGLFSIKHLIIDKNYEPNEMLIFPQPLDRNVTRVLMEMQNDTSLKFHEQLDNYTIFENENALPLVYATKRYVFYDEIETLRYATQLLDFRDLPVFLDSGGQTNQFYVPEFINADIYRVNALTLPDNNSTSELTLVVTNGANSSTFSLQKVTTMDDVNIFSTLHKLSPGDTVEFLDSENLSDARQIDDLVLNSTSSTLGTYNSFMLNFTVNVLKKGQYSFLAPRVILDVDGLKKYFVTFHDNGVLELAVESGKVWVSSVITKYIGYTLENQSDLIDVYVRRVFDEVNIYINGNLAMSFPIEPKLSTVSLSSENSISRFSNIHVGTRKVARLFAVRQVSTAPDFHLQTIDPTKCVIDVSNDRSDFAVVTQYLYTGLRNVKTEVAGIEVKTNGFFQGWVLNAIDLDSKEISIEISVENSRITDVLVAFSISFVYIMVLAEIAPNLKRVLETISKISSKVLEKIGQRDNR